ncbi:MAG: tyrosine-type recombinase/integrase [SAR324 cluster bacterium]|nr:tyrosine-type recombinase/integrase [SAR324 cluster bacterium]MBF0352128.1 tyrosine-type recombinase/integrase [SAR324 cluster bacterium]
MDKQNPRKPFARSFTVEEIQIICQKLEDKDRWYYHYFLFALNTGMRRSEILALTWHHVDLWKCREIIVPDLKNTPSLEGSLRRIPIDETLLGVLLELRSPSRWVFQKTGKRMLAGTVTLFFSELSRKLGIPVTSERIRWTFAMRMFHEIGPVSNKDWKKLQKLLGHKDGSTTRSYFQRNLHRHQSEPVK